MTKDGWIQLVWVVVCRYPQSMWVNQWTCHEHGWSLSTHTALAMRTATGLVRCLVYLACFPCLYHTTRIVHTVHCSTSGLSISCRLPAYWGMYLWSPRSRTSTDMPTSTQLSRFSGELVLGNRGVTCIPRQPLSLAPSSTSRCFLRALSGSTGWRWPVSWSTLGSLQLWGVLVGVKGSNRGSIRKRILTEQSGTKHGIPRHRACCPALG